MTTRDFEHEDMRHIVLALIDDIKDLKARS